MNPERLKSAGIKQIIRLEWLEKAANLALSGLNAKETRQELHEFLRHRKGDGSTETRGETSRAQIVTIIMKIWITPDLDLLQFRDGGLNLLQKYGSGSLPIHWAAISAAYPFWFNVAKQVGRLLGLQDQVQKQQIDKRLREQYGDRETIDRYGRQVVRSYVVWDILSDTDFAGCYGPSKKISIHECDITAFLVESAIRSSGEEKRELSRILSAPSFFPFAIATFSGSQIRASNPRLDIQRIASGDEIVGIAK